MTFGLIAIAELGDKTQLTQLHYPLDMAELKFGKIYIQSSILSCIYYTDFL